MKILGSIIYMKNSDKKGLWIPIEILEDENLSTTEKILLSEIYSLTELPDGCFASNDHFATLLGITKGAASKRIDAIKTKGYINTEVIFDKKSCVGRIITKAKKPKKVKNETGQVLQESTSLRKQTPVPKEIEGSSFSTREVLPDQPDPTSPEKPISTTINSDILKQDNYNTGVNDLENEDLFDFEGLMNPEQEQREFQEIEKDIMSEEIGGNSTSTGTKKYSGVSESGMMSMYKFARLQFESARDFLATSTKLRSEIFNYANEKKFFLLKEKLEPEVYAEIVTPMKDYIQARIDLGLDKK